MIKPGEEDEIEAKEEDERETKEEKMQEPENTVIETKVIEDSVENKEISLNIYIVIGIISVLGIILILIARKKNK